MQIIWDKIIVLSELESQCDLLRLLYLLCLWNNYEDLAALPNSYRCGRKNKLLLHASPGSRAVVI